MAIDFIRNWLKLSIMLLISLACAAWGGWLAIKGGPNIWVHLFGVALFASNIIISNRLLTDISRRSI